MSDPSQKTIAVAMSGGVDSSAAAAVLLSNGHRVFGITMNHFESPCDRAAHAVSDARGVCDTLGIEHHVVEMINTFNEKVIDNFIQEYLAGRTPNPCVRCNRMIKWGALMTRAFKLGADHFATGHYARIAKNPGTNRFELLKSANTQKDQSYALWRLDQRQLSKTLFPLESLTKTDVRRIAADFSLDIAEKQESQDICFIPDDDYNNYIVQALKQRGERIEPGDIIDMQGQVVGQHRGYPFYTIGQRKGLGVALGRPVFVNHIDAARNRIRIGEKSDLYSSGLTATQTNWIARPNPTVGMPVKAHIRYNDPGYNAEIVDVSEDSVEIRFDEPRLSITPGQSVVFYDGDKVVGGGIIENAVQ